MNDTLNDYPQQESRHLNVNLWQMKEVKTPHEKPLSLRARLCYGKLLGLSRPATARGLSRLFGGISINERTVSTALNQLLHKGMVTKSKEGWTAVPCKERRDLFDWAKDNTHPYYFPIPTPEHNPWPQAKNAVELLVVYSYLKHESRYKNNTVIADKTGIGRKAVGMLVHQLVREGYLDNVLDKNALSQTWRNAVYSPEDRDVLKPKPKAHARAKAVEEDEAEERPERPAVCVLLKDLKLESECLNLIGQLTKLNVPLEGVIVPDIRKALEQHRVNSSAGRVTGDGSALVRSFLQHRLDSVSGPQKRKEAYSNAVSAEADQIRARKEEREREAGEWSKLRGDILSALSVAERCFKKDQIRSLLAEKSNEIMRQVAQTVDGVKELTVEQLEFIFRHPSHEDMHWHLAQKESVIASGHPHAEATEVAAEVFDTSKCHQTVRPASVKKPLPEPLDADLVAALDDCVVFEEDENQFLGMKDCHFVK